MPNTDGWIKIDRQIMNSDIWEDSEPFDCRSAWIDLIMMANYEEKTFYTRHGKAITIPRGSLFTSSQHLADRWHWSRGKVVRFLRSLNGTAMCTSLGTPDGQLLTLVNYDKFQGPRSADGTALGTADGTADGTRLKNYKEIKKERNNMAPKPISERLEAIRRFSRMENPFDVLRGDDDNEAITH